MKTAAQRASQLAVDAVTPRVPPGAPTELVLQTLQRHYKLSKRGNAIGSSRRVSVVSKELCDDVLERLKPSLLKHEGCDILDINPGPAIFSSKLHDLLKPRKHILMEQERVAYTPFLQPLLDAPDSKYVWVKKSGLLFKSLEKVLNEQNFPHQKVLDKDDPRISEPNPTMLVVMNIAFFPKWAFMGFQSIAHLFINQMMAAIITHSYFQKYGLVRILAWVDDQDRFLALPRHVHSRKKGSLAMAVACSRITEVASSTVPSTYLSRDLGLELESVRKVILRMEANGTKTPPGRESLFLGHALGLHGADHRMKKGQQDTERFVKELPDLEARFAAGKFPKRYPMPEKEREKLHSKMIVAKTKMAGSKPKIQGALTPEYKRLAMLRTHRNTFERRAKVLETLRSRQREIFTKIKELHHSKGIRATKKKERVAASRREFIKDLESVPDRQVLSMATGLLDTDRVSTIEPSGIIYDRREYEPLKARPEEFCPQRPLALLDFEPQTVLPALKENPENYLYVDYIMAHVTRNTISSVKVELERLWPGAYEYLLEEVPSLSDPTKGGDTDLELMRTRCLTHEHVADIVEAWMRWPYRPTLEQIRARNNNSVLDKVDDD